METTPRLWCRSCGTISSANAPPHTLSPPLPVPVGSPPCTMKPWHSTEGTAGRNRRQRASAGANKGARRARGHTAHSARSTLPLRQLSRARPVEPARPTRAAGDTRDCRPTPARLSHRAARCHLRRAAAARRPALLPCSARPAPELDPERAHLHVAVELGSVVCARGGQREEVEARARRVLAVQLELQVAQRRVQRDGHGVNAATRRCCSPPPQGPRRVEGGGFPGARHARARRLAGGRAAPAEVAKVVAAKRQKGSARHSAGRQLHGRRGAWPLRRVRPGESGRGCRGAQGVGVSWRAASSVSRTDRDRHCALCEGGAPARPAAMPSSSRRPRRPAAIGAAAGIAAALAGQGGAAAGGAREPRERTAPERPSRPRRGAAAGAAAAVIAAGAEASVTGIAVAEQGCGGAGGGAGPDEEDDGVEIICASGRASGAGAGLGRDVCGLGRELGAWYIGVRANAPQCAWELAAVGACLLMRRCAFFVLQGASNARWRRGLPRVAVYVAFSCRDIVAHGRR